ncbi:hypothetical protein AGMMS50256_37610 [Betaproteobacteria bacterium]|nr:hypothetical protein AGMMS50256_37610 [Betaproteobacteria bacterium]
MVIYSAPVADFNLDIGAGAAISGGNGGTSGAVAGGGGGAGLVADGLSHISMNAGTINGGGGSVVFLSVDGSSFTQSAGSINGGAGGSTTGTNAYAAGLGGDGLWANNSQITLSGTVTGGVGGSSGAGAAGNGGSGLYTWSTDATIHSEISVNSGATVIGGDGGTTASGTAGDGGVGVRLTGDNSLLINAGAIQGGLANNGAGTQANAVSIEGDNNIVELRNGYSFTGNVVVESGAGNILRLGGSDDSSFDADTIGNGTNGQYRGFAAFEKNGMSSTWVVTGTDSSAKPWTISEGTLQIGNNGTSGSISGNINNNASLVFKRSDTVIYGGMIGGTGSLTQAGSGTLVLTGASDYNGGTIISAGTLQIGNGGATGSIRGSIVNNAALTAAPRSVQGASVVRAA